MSSRGSIGCAIALSVCGCGGAGVVAPTTSNPTPSVPTEITINVTATGFKPMDGMVAVGGRVIFDNVDDRLHAVASNPITTHADCPPINEVGVLVPGQSKPTGVLTEARICEFHDTFSEGSKLLVGRFTVR
jgi:plastocyanin